MDKLDEIKNKVSKSNPITPFSLSEVEHLLGTIEKLQEEKEGLRLEVCRLYDKYCR